MVGLAIGAVLAAIVTHGFVQLVCAGLFGAVLTLLLFGWIVGGDVYSLPWIWGSIGERQTEDALSELGAEWAIEHDIPCRWGNWDHVVVGPGGLFLLDTKRLHGRVTARQDGLHAGRSRYSGASFRSAARNLSTEVPAQTWVHPVVVVWGDFAQRRHEESGVAYVIGTEIAAWLKERPQLLDRDRRAQLATAVTLLRKS
jgi:hypothetical protein